MVENKISELSNMRSMTLSLPKDERKQAISNFLTLEMYPGFWVLEDHTILTILVREERGAGKIVPNQEGHETDKSMAY